MLGLEVVDLVLIGGGVLVALGRSRVCRRDTERVYSAECVGI